MINLNNEKNKLSLSGASSEPIISAESKRDPRLIATQSPRMTEKALSFLRLRGASGVQGISAPASCRKAHKRRFILNQWILRFAYAQPLKMTTLAFLLSLNLSTAFADYCTCTWSGADNKTLTITNCSYERLYSSSCANQETANNVIIGTGVTSIAGYTFENAFSLTSITLPDSVTSIGSYAFKGATGLTNITIPEGVKSIGGGAFYGASSLESITIPDSVTRIGDDAFKVATGLKSITIPDSVTRIGDDAFKNAFSLTNIMCKGDKESCAATVRALRAAGYTGNISYPTDKTSCEGTGVSLFVWDGSKCSRRNEAQCNSVAKYYYSDGKCQVLPKTQSACTGTNIEWNATDNKCVNKNYTPSQEDNNGNTGGDDIGDVSGDFNPADCYNNGQVPYNNQCLDEYPFAKKRWTPAEANEWLHDGNDNFVVITFKK